MKIGQRRKLLEGAEKIGINPNFDKLIMIHLWRGLLHYTYGKEVKELNHKRLRAKNGDGDWIASYTLIGMDNIGTYIAYCYLYNYASHHSHYDKSVLVNLEWGSWETNTKTSILNETKTIEGTC